VLFVLCVVCSFVCSVVVFQFAFFEFMQPLLQEVGSPILSGAGGKAAKK